MPESKPPLIALSSEIGRGHPQYLDSVLEFLPDVPRMKASGWGWSLARRIYWTGAKGGVFTASYNWIRERSRPSRLQLALLDSGLRRRFAGYRGILLVDHPLLAHLLAPVCRLAYLHGEVAAPPICAVPSVWRIFVPLEFTARCLEALGVERKALYVTGLIIEPQLVEVAELLFEKRLSRLKSNQSLTIGFFTSGAYPAPHIRQIVLAARSAVASGHQLIVFCGTNRKRAQTIGKHLPTGSKVIISTSRQEETKLTVELFSQLDVMVAASHERTNWAVGLGLPLFALLPHIGPFAPLNFEFAYNQGVCLPLNDATNFGAMLDALGKEGRLTEMAGAGCPNRAITGAKTIAEFLLSCNHNLSET